MFIIKLMIIENFSVKTVNKSFYSYFLLSVVIIGKENYSYHLRICIFQYNNFFFYYYMDLCFAHMWIEKEICNIRTLYTSGSFSSTTNATNGNFSATFKWQRYAGEVTKVKSRDKDRQREQKEYNSK